MSPSCVGAGQISGLRVFVVVAALQGQSIFSAAWAGALAKAPFGPGRLGHGRGRVHPLATRPESPDPSGSSLAGQSLEQGQLRLGAPQYLCKQNITPATA